MMPLSHRFAAIWLALALSTGTAFAQARTPSPGHLAAAREVVMSSGIPRSFEIIPSQMADQIKQNAVTRPEITKDLGEVLAGLNPEMDLQKQQMVNNAAKVFANRMTEAELKEVAAFFKTPAGVKYVQTQPVVLDDLVKEMHTWTQELAEYMMVRVRAEMSKRGHQLQ